MAIPTTTSVPTGPPLTTVLARAAAAEWTRLWTLRSTWWSLLAAAGLMLFVDEIELAASTVAIVMVAWTVATLGAGGWSLIRRDAS